MKRNLTVILNSSQSKTPCGQDGWIVSTRKAVDELVDGGHTMITSIGLMTWELVLYLAAAKKGSQVIVSPYIDDDDGETTFKKTLYEFGLDEDRTAMVFVTPEPGSRKPKTTWVKRDKAAIYLAGVIVPVSTRPGGKLERLLELNRATRKIISDYEMKHERSMVRPPRYEKEAISFEMKNWEHITHWTRTHHGPWPGQKKCDFYKSLIESKDIYPNNAFNSIRRIAREGIIRASSKRLRAGVEAVAFTESAPPEVLAKMRWLPKRVNWNFEPYAVAIEKATATEMGIRSVVYGGDDEYENLTAGERPYFQSRGQKDVDWRAEREWRHKGDLDFSNVREEQIVFLVWSRRERSLMESESGWRTISIGND